METVKSHCNRCHGETNQAVLHKETVKWAEVIDENEEMGVFKVSGTDAYQMLKCLGCDSISFKHISWFSENRDSQGNIRPELAYYPPSIYRTEPTWLNELDNILEGEEHKFIYDLMKEIYSSLHNDSRRLATMGIRALIEHIMIKKVSDQGSFPRNIDKFEEMGFISVSQKEILKAVLEAGHATIHRSYSPTVEDLHTCMDIAESIVESVYIHPTKANKLKGKIPPRK